MLLFWLWPSRTSTHISLFTVNRSKATCREVFSVRGSGWELPRGQPLCPDKGWKLKEREKEWHSPGIPNHFSMGGVDWPQEQHLQQEQQPPLRQSTQRRAIFWLIREPQCKMLHKVYVYQAEKSSNSCQLEQRDTEGFMDTQWCQNKEEFRFSTASYVFNLKYGTYLLKYKSLS